MCATWAPQLTENLLLALGVGTGWCPQWVFRHGEDLRASHLSTPSLAVPVLCLQEPCPQAQGPHLCQTQVPRAFAIGAWPYLVHVSRWTTTTNHHHLVPCWNPCGTLRQGEDLRAPRLQQCQCQRFKCLGWYPPEVHRETSDQEQTHELPDGSALTDFTALVACVVRAPVHRHRAWGSFQGHVHRHRASGALSCVQGGRTMYPGTRSDGGWTPKLAASCGASGLYGKATQKKNSTTTRRLGSRSTNTSVVDLERTCVSCACACFHDHIRAAMSAARLVEAAQRSCERRQRSWWRDEQLSVACVVATALQEQRTAPEARAVAGREHSPAGWVWVSVQLRAVMSPTALSFLHSLIRSFLVLVDHDLTMRLWRDSLREGARPPSVEREKPIVMSRSSCATWCSLMLPCWFSHWKAPTRSRPTRFHAATSSLSAPAVHAFFFRSWRKPWSASFDFTGAYFRAQHGANHRRSPAASRGSSLMRVCSTKWNSPCTCSCVRSLRESVKFFSSFHRVYLFQCKSWRCASAGPVRGYMFAVLRTWNCRHYFSELVVAFGGISHISSLASHAVHSLPCPSRALACSGLTASPPCFAARSFAAVAASAARAAVLPAHDATGAGSRERGGQGPRGRRGTKAGVSSPSEDKSSDLHEAYLRTVGRVRLVVGVQSGAAHQVTVQDRGGSPSVHLGVWDTLSVTLSHGVGIWQQLGGRKVRGTARWSVWVLQVSPGKNAAHRS